MTRQMQSVRVSKGRFIASALVWLYAGALALPIYFLLVSAFKDNFSIFNTPLALPHSFSIKNFADAWNTARLGPALANSTEVAFLCEIATIALAAPAAYGLARSSGRARDVVERLFGLGFLIPAFAALVPTLLLSIRIHLYHSLFFYAAFLVATTMPLSVILLTQFMRSIPAELEESAFIDGAGRWDVLRYVYAPLARGGVALIVILNFLTYWNEYLFSLVLVGYTGTTRTVQVALPTLINETHTIYGMLLAGTVITLVPVYAVYIVFQRKLQEALLAGAVKM